MTFKAVQIIEPLVDLNQPLKINHIETPKLNGNQVPVSYTHLTLPTNREV